MSRNLIEIITHIPKLFIYLTTKCNMHCKHCYLGSRLKEDLRFSPNDVINILDIFSEFRGKKDVTFLGGEPTLYHDINKILKYARDMGYYVRLDTNGFYNIYIMQRIKLKYVDEINISLDGSVPNIHDSIRIHGSFESAIQNIKYLISIRKNVRVITTVMKPNLLNVPKLAKVVENLGVSNLNLHLLSINGNARRYPELWVSPKEWLCLIYKLWNMKWKNLVIRFPLAYLPKNLVEYNKKFLECECNDLSRLSFFPDGRVYCCSLLFDTNLNVGYYNSERAIILLQPNSEFHIIKENKECIAKKFTTQQNGFVTLCRFKKIETSEKKFNRLISRIGEILKC